MYRCKLWIYNIRRNDLEKRVKKEGYGFLKITINAFGLIIAYVKIN